MIYQATNHSQREYNSILTHKKIKNMNESFRVYNDSAILNRVLEFPVTLFWTETRILGIFWISISGKNNVKPSFVKVTRLYVVDELWRAVEIPCPTCPTWSHFIQDKMKVSIYLSLDKCKICIKLIKFIFHILINYYEFTCCIENSVDPDISLAGGQ